MARNLLVSFEVRNWVKQGALIVAAIEELGEAARVFGSVWYVRSKLTAVQAAERVRDVIDPRDGLIVIDVSHNLIATCNVDDRAIDFMMRNWQRPLHTLSRMQASSRTTSTRGSDVASENAALLVRRLRCSPLPARTRT
jgi:hypothetical protein